MENKKREKKCIPSKTRAPFAIENKIVRNTTIMVCDFARIILRQRKSKDFFFLVNKKPRFTKKALVPLFPVMVATSLYVSYVRFFNCTAHQERDLCVGKVMKIFW
jgi:hypothetical protein